MIIDDPFEALALPFDAKALTWRVGATTQDKSKGMALAYIDARDVMERLDEVLGVAGWQNRYSHAEGKTVCEIGVKVAGEWIWKADGAGDTDYEADKGALSDAFKRAAVRWGIGRYLYAMASPWVEIEPAGPKSFRIKKSVYDSGELEKAALAAAVTVEWGDPDDRATVKALANTIRTCILSADHVRLYREKNNGVIAQLRVKARAHINKLLEEIAEQSEAIDSSKGAGAEHPRAA